MTGEETPPRISKDAMYAELFDRIYEGHYPAEFRLKEAILAKEFGTSRTPVREVLNRLARIGLIRIVPNRGAVVVGLSHDDVEEIYEIRKALEILALRFAVPVIRLQELSDLRSQVQAIGTETQPEQVAEIDNILHMYIVEASHRHHLKQMLGQLYQLIQPMRLVAYHDPEGILRARQEHLELIGALFRRDLEEAGRVLAEHLERSKAVVLSYLFHHG